jgi:hypothetical protein
MIKGLREWIHKAEEERWVSLSLASLPLRAMMPSCIVRSGGGKVNLVAAVYGTNPSLSVGYTSFPKTNTLLLPSAP